MIKNIRPILLLITLSLVTLASCQKEQNKETEEAATTSFTDKQLGQMIVVGFRGTEINKESAIVQDIKKYNLGGFVLFDYDVEQKQYGRNITDPDQLLQLSSALVGYSSTPPIIAIDQEGGRVARLKERQGFPKTVSAQYLGEVDNEDTTRAYIRTMAQEFMVVGVNTNFAPVVDVNTNPDNPVIGSLGRSFSSDPNKVAEHAGYFIDEFDTEGVLTVLKHFPGHGSSNEDSHLGVTDVTNTWDESELIPYKKLFREKEIHAVMTAHIFNANIDSVWPATLSSNTINGLLRDSLGFEGVVFSDDMQMKAIADEYGLETSIEQALNAGVDILIFGNNLEFDPNIAEKAINAIQKLIADGRVSTETIEQALARIDKLKQDVIAELCTCLN
ncbi:glycoside hydrolase family 3 protein [Balneola vulgaris]|uniref:glycoside hydrolase family 3 protein n=1 Tax=Balneola vulgaris TaxID=287535 RepID=UPI0003675959|nr:glycoside hydrolase family 3 protein [Balneola vulgaris]